MEGILDGVAFLIVKNSLVPIFEKQRIAEIKGPLKNEEVISTSSFQVSASEGLALCRDLENPERQLFRAAMLRSRFFSKADFRISHGASEKLSALNHSVLHVQIYRAKLCARLDGCSGHY